MQTTTQLTTQDQVRDSFWEHHREFSAHEGKRQNQCPCDVRVAFVEWIDYLARSGVISQALASRVTL